MKTSNRANTFFKKQIHLLLSILKKKESSFSENDFHSIRIAIKRIKALFALVEKSNSSFHQKKYFAPFKLVFEQAGQIRDKEVIQSILHAHPYNASIENFEFDLQRHIIKEKKQFFKMTTSTLWKDIRHSQVKASRFLDKNQSKTGRKNSWRKRKSYFIPN
jgi:CHAD domain-containing protein